MIQVNRRNGPLVAAARAAGQIAAYTATRALGGATRGVGNRVSNAARRYFQGDVNQPTSARTVQQTRPMRPQRRGIGRAGSVVSEVGSLKLADITTGASVGIGRCVMSLPLQMERIGGRIYELSKLYSRYRFTSMVLRYVPAVSSTTDGSIVLYYTQDPDDTYANQEPVGANNAVSAIDNLEFSVREKANMRLHVNPQLLYTTPSPSERSWHSSGVINVIDNGALVVNKTYGSLYADFSVRFEQPCAPFDVFSPLFNKDALFAPTGTGAGGAALGNLFRWSTDLAELDPSCGHYWTRDPITGDVNVNGLLYMPPYTTVVMTLWGQTDAVTGGYNVDLAGGSVLLYGASWQSVDFTAKSATYVFTNPSANVASLRVNPSVGFVTTKIGLTVTLVPFRGS